MEDSRKLDRTWLCSVLFLDIVSYSSQAVETQVEWKNFFNASLSEAILAVPENDRIILDTGDGAVICFLGDPEAALLSGLAILNQFRARHLNKSHAFVRIGINLGPIRLLRDINNNLNAIGDGINVGQRVMSFAAGNQLLISRSYYEVISTLSETYKRLFRFEGVRQDKHTREHSVYALVPESTSEFEAPIPAVMPAISVEVSREAPSPLETPAPFRPEELKSIELVLSDFAGPIAKHLVTKASKQAHGLEALFEILAELSVPPSDRGVFFKRCRALLGLAPSSEPPASKREQVPGVNRSRPAGERWDALFLEKLKRDLAEYLGPIAGILVTRAVDLCQTQEELYSALAREITSDRERQKFLASQK
jgi:class 3 adenylate cyclase